MNQLLNISPLIKILRGQRVILDSDLAALYGVPTKQLNQACNRNIEKFPEDFRFLLTRQEVEELRSQFVTLESKVGRTYLPYAFTEHGALMAANLLRSKQAVDVSIKVVRAFVQMRQMRSGIAELERKIEKLEKEYDQKFSDVDAEFANVFETLRQLILPPPPSKKNKIGYI